MMEQNLLVRSEAEQQAIADARFVSLIHSIIERKSANSPIGKELTLALELAQAEQFRRRTATPPETYKSLKQIFAEYLFDETSRFPDRKVESAALMELVNQSVVADVQGVLLQESVKAERAAKELAGIDVLTGVFNRRKIDEILENWLTSFRKEDKEREFAVVLIDIDEFKSVNDTFGHIYGDEILKKFAQVLQTCFRKADDVIGRWGGEEFVVLLRMPEAQVAKKLEELWQKLQEKIDPDKNLQVTGSIGWTMRLAHQEISATNLTDQADKAMYQIKTTGKNGIKRFSADQVPI